jgi:hypothetical protein
VLYPSGARLLPGLMAGRAASSGGTVGRKVSLHAEQAERRHAVTVPSSDPNTATPAVAKERAHNLDGFLHPPTLRDRPPQPEVLAAAILKPRRNANRPSSFSAKMNRQPSWRATS